MKQTVLLTLISLTLVSCVGQEGHVDRSFVSAELERRTGFSIGPRAAPGESSWPPDVVVEDGITESEAIETALWNNRSLREALADLGVANADLVEAGTLRNPVLTLLFPIGPKQLEATAKFPLEAVWLRSRKVSLAATECERVAAVLIQHGSDLVRDVRVALAEHWAAQSQGEMASEALDARRRQAELVRRQLKLGELGGADANRAAIDERLAVEVFSEQTMLVAESRRRILALLGLKTSMSEVVFKRSPLVQSLAIGLEADELLAQAFAMRTDLRAAELAIMATEQRADLAGVVSTPVSAVADANAKGSKGFEAGPGIELAIPVFNQHQGVLARLDADRQKALLHVDSVRFEITREVESALAHCRQATDQYRHFREKVLPEIEKSIALARASVESGDSTEVPVLEARVRRVEFMNRWISICASVRKARAELDRCVGRRLPIGAQHGDWQEP